MTTYHAHGAGEPIRVPLPVGGSYFVKYKISLVPQMPDDWIRCVKVKTGLHHDIAIGQCRQSASRAKAAAFIWLSNQLRVQALSKQLVNIGSSFSSTGGVEMASRL